MKKVDMSEKAVLQRLRQVDQLRELSLSLMKAGQSHAEKAVKQGRQEKGKIRSAPTPKKG